MTPETVYQRFRKKRITTVTRLDYDNVVYLASCVSKLRDVRGDVIT